MARERKTGQNSVGSGARGTPTPGLQCWCDQGRASSALAVVLPVSYREVARHTAITPRAFHPDGPGPCPRSRPAPSSGHVIHSGCRPGWWRFWRTGQADLGGVPLLVNSGYRPPAYNREIGGAGSSLHLDGLAADVACLQVPFARLAEAADRLVGERGGVGLYRSQDFVHVDLRGERGERVRWP